MQIAKKTGPQTGEPTVATGAEVFRVDKGKSFYLQKTTGWGVKTFSEIMREKRLQRLANREAESTSAAANPPEPNTSSTKPRENAGKNSSDVKNDVTIKNEATKRKFTPIVFDLEESREKTRKTSPKKLKPIVYDEPETETTEVEPIVWRSASRENVASSEIGENYMKLCLNFESV